MFKKFLMFPLLSIVCLQANATETSWPQFFKDLKHSNYQRESVESADKKTQASFYRNINNDTDVRFAGFGVLTLVDSVQLVINTDVARFKHSCDLNRTFGDPIDMKLVIKTHDFTGLNFKLKNGKNYSLDQVQNPIAFGEIKSETQTDNDQLKSTLDKMINEAMKSSVDKNNIAVDLSNNLLLACNISANRTRVRLTMQISYEKTAEFTGSFLVGEPEFSDLYNSFWDRKEKNKDASVDESFANNVLTGLSMSEKVYKREDVLKGSRLQDITEALSTNERKNLDSEISKQWLITLEYKVPTNDRERLYTRAMTISDSSAELKTVTIK